MTPSPSHPQENPPATLGEAHPVSRAPGDPDTSFESQLSNIRHTLRTPLNQIIGYSEMLQEEAGDQGIEAFVPDLQRIHAAGGQLLALINENLASARVMAGELDVNRLQRDGRSLLNLVIGYSEMCAEEAQKAGKPRAEEDVGKIRLAASRLLEILESRENANLLRACCQAARHSHQTTVIERVQPPATAAESGPAPATTLTGRLLVVDDNELNRDMLSRRLERLGHTVLRAENGRQALDLLRANKVDLILLDLIMPEMDGVETLEKLKATPALRHTPVIMLSASDEMDRVVRCIEIGADDYLQKPFNPVLLKARINAGLEKKRMRDQEEAFLEQLQIEREKSEKLLLNILPHSIADRLKQGETTIADSFPDVTVLFADLVEFTNLASRMSHTDLVRLLNEVFSQFDWLTEMHHLEKIKTIGDAYMVVGGLPEAQPNHAMAVAEMALDMQKVVARMSARGGPQLDIRIGICTGPVVAGIIGSKKFVYDLWGDTVNTASRMESQGRRGSIHVSETTFLRLRDHYAFEERGQIPIRGKGQMTTYFLSGRKTG